MSRQLPPSVTADTTPDWLPAGWISHSTVLKRGRQTRTYTNLRTGKKFSTKDQVLEYIKMEKIQVKRESAIERTKASLKAVQDSVAARARPSWLPDDWIMEPRIGGYGGNPYTMYVNMSTGFKTISKKEVLEYQYTMDSESESEASLGKVEETETNYISYDYDMDEEDYSENEYVKYKGSRVNVENSSNVTSTPLRSQPERMQKLESRAKTQCVFEDEDMSSDSDIKLPDAKALKEEGCNEANDLEEARVVSHLAESEGNLHDVVAGCVDKAREIPGLTGSFSIEINLECEPASNKSGTEGIATRNIELHLSDSSKVEDKIEEPLKAQAEQEETANESRSSVFFPYREAPSHSALVFENSNARSSPEDLSNTMGLGLNPQEKNIGGSKKQRMNTETCSPKNIKKKDTEAPTKLGKKGSPSVGVENKPIEWPEPCPNFPFEPLTRSLQVEDDSVIRRYLEEHSAAAGSGDSNLPLPDFGLPSFSDIKISRDEEPESKEKKYPDPPCVPVASSSLPTYNAMGTTTMQQRVAGN
ncbi:unnamed protein product [Arabis nemorensis]|uniref:MBD domain-containing protein n=1 Tax=Arabis nemorensis TaxID=586526 RepID=A0A565AYR4_9BRAS|nr:unnamed protein product [Arabis nemorensis]